jgi:flagellar basal-body rod protein FlgC
MDLSHLFSISASGLQEQRLRMNVISSNLANMQSTRTVEGGPYQRRFDAN